jgi:hypothetical protein
VFAAGSAMADERIEPKSGSCPPLTGR